MDEVKYLDVVSLVLQKIPGTAKHLALGVNDQIGAVDAHNTGLAEKAGLAGTAAAHHQNIEVALVLIAVQPYGNVLCQDNVFTVWIGILLVQFTGITPFGRAVFLAGAAVFMIGVI